MDRTQFKSLDDLVWYLQNNGGGQIVIDIHTEADDRGVCLRLERDDGAWSGMGMYPKHAVAKLLKE